MLENSAPNKAVHSVLKQFCQKVLSFVSALGVCSVTLFLLPESKQYSLIHADVFFSLLMALPFLECSLALGGSLIVSGFSVVGLHVPEVLAPVNGLMLSKSPQNLVA